MGLDSRRRETLLSRQLIELGVYRAVPLQLPDGPFRDEADREVFRPSMNAAISGSGPTWRRSRRMLEVLAADLRLRHEEVDTEGIQPLLPMIVPEVVCRRSCRARRVPLGSNVAGRGQPASWHRRPTDGRASQRATTFSSSWTAYPRLQQAAASDEDQRPRIGVDVEAVGLTSTEPLKSFSSTQARWPFSASSSTPCAYLATQSSTRGREFLLSHDDAAR